MRKRHYRLALGDAPKIGDEKIVVFDRRVGLPAPNEPYIQEIKGEHWDRCRSRSF